VPILHGIDRSKVAFTILKMFYTVKGFHFLEHFVANLLLVILGKCSKYDLNKQIAYRNKNKLEYYVDLNPLTKFSSKKRFLHVNFYCFGRSSKF
jgi:hypothetical protein